MVLSEALLTSGPIGSLVLRPIARRGYRRFGATGETPRWAHGAMRKLFAADPDAFEDLVARAGAEHPLLAGLDRSVGLAAGEIDRVVDSLRRDGVATLTNLVPERECAELELVARASECVLTGGDSAARARFDPERPVAVRYDLDEVDVARSAAVQRLLADETLLAIAQGYLGAAPIQDLVAMWWSTAHATNASSGAAQLFHFDLDRLRFLKVFVYLTAVDEETGPHSFVRGTHRDLPGRFRHARRYEDSEVLPAFDDRVTEICGPRGTVFVADTRGLHRGRLLRSGHRLVFQMEYATSLFGAPMNRIALSDVEPELKDVAARYRDTYRRFAID